MLGLEKKNPGTALPGLGLFQYKANVGLFAVNPKKSKRNIVSFINRFWNHRCKRWLLTWLCRIWLLDLYGVRVGFVLSEK